MSDFLEALITLLPSEAGGRASAIYPRNGSYRPFVSAGGERLRIRVIEGPPSIAPGHEGQIVAEIESGAPPPSAFVRDLAAGAELELIENERCVGILSVMRLRRAMPA